MPVRTVDVRLSKNKRGTSECSDSAIPNSLAVELTLYSFMVKVVDCHARDSGSNPVRRKRFFHLELYLL